MWMNKNQQEKIHIIDTTSMPISLVYATAKGDKLFIRKYREGNLDGLPGAMIQPPALESFLNKAKIGNNSTVIFLWSGMNAATFTADVSLKKQHSEIPLTEVDVNRIFETATFQFFTQFREEAKKRFKVDDLGLVLSSNRILDFKLDGETYINLESIKAKRADVAIEQTFLRRQLHEIISDNINSTNNILHIEIGTALFTLAKTSGLNVDESIFIHVGKTRSYIYSSEVASRESIKFNSSLQYRGDINIGTSDIFLSLKDKLGIKISDSTIFIDSIIKKGASPKLISAIKKAILGTSTKLLEECREKALNTGKIILFLPEPLATFMENSEFSKNMSSIIFTSLNKTDILHQEISTVSKIDPRALSPAFFAGLIAYWSRLGDNNIGVRKRGNVGWLIPHNSI